VSTPLEQRAKQRYQGSEGEEYHRAKRSIPPAAFGWVSRLRAAKIEPFVLPTDTVLEYGVGLGWNVAALNCGRKIGYDAGEFLAAEVAGHGIEFMRDLSPVPSGSIDVVLCHHTLEHAGNPGEVLGECHRLLRPGGRLLVFVPYEKERRYRQFRPDEPNHHLFSWNVQTLGNLVQEAGYAVELAQLLPFGQERFAADLAHRLRLGEPGFRVLHWMANWLKHEFEVSLIGRKGRS